MLQKNYEKQQCKAQNQAIGNGEKVKKTSYKKKKCSRFLKKENEILLIQRPEIRVQR